MPDRRLHPDERALWRRVTESVTPLARARRGALPVPTPVPQTEPPAPPRPRGRIPPPLAPRPAASPPPADTLDGGWERRLKRGLTMPDRTVDLHGHSLAAAHAALEAALARALADDLRVLLVVTGRPPRPGAERRGLIRAGIGDWLASSPHASRIAAVRAAHPRHGGAGALYVILRRRRERTGA